MSVACPRCATPVREGARFCDTCGSPASPVSPLSPGSGGGGPAPGLPPRYEVLRFLGRGGMGRVYLCRDTDLDVEVAIKVLPAEVAADEEALQQIQKEARAAAKFRECPGILSLYGFERHGDTRYLVMDFAAGGSLHDLLKKEGRLPEADCRRLGAEVADALAYSHEKKVLHRDIKPANVLLDANGRARVADFGIAKVMADTSARMSMMTVAGTPIYMAPEIVLQKKVDHRADLYSLGCMLYEMSTGERPFQGAYHEIMAAKMMAGAVAPDPREKNPDLTEDFAACVQRLLAPDPDDRFPEAAACAKALREGRGEPAAAEATGVPDTLPPSDNRSVAGAPLPKTVAIRQHPSRVPLWAGALVLAALGIGGWALFGRGGEVPTSPKNPPAKTPDRREEASAPGLEAPGGKPPVSAPGEAPPKESPVEGPGAAEKTPDKTPEKTPGSALLPPPAPKPAPGLLVVTDPPGATITVDGVEKGIAEKDGLLVADLDPAADHVIKAWLDDYATAEETGVRWASGERKNLPLILARLTGLLLIEGGPPGAKVRAERPGAPPREEALAEDGTLGPVSFEVGEWTVTLSKKGFDPWTGAAKIEVGSTAKVTAAPRERDGTLALDTDPPGADVYDRETPLGTAPLRRKLAAGRHSIRLVHPDTEEVTREVVVRGEEPIDLGKVPLPALAILDFSGLPEGVTAEVGGKPAGVSVRQTAGEVEILWKKAKCRPQTGRETLHAGRTTRPIPPGNWTVIPGRLGLSALPADVALTVDGTSVVRSGNSVEVEPGTHTVGLSRKGYRPVAGQIITVDADQDAHLSNPSWVVLVTVTPAVPNLPPPPDAVLAGQMALAVLPQGFVRTEDGRIYCEKDGAEMVLVPAGEFTMGSDDSGQKDEKPAHRVTVSEFLVDRLEVTVGQFKKFCAATGKAMPGQRSETTDRHPVVNVDWNDAKAFAEWAERRLPTEAEWEKAARGKGSRVYPWGDADDEKRRNGSGGGDGFDGLAPVGSFASGASPCGALDMAGNVWEWCADWYDEKYYGTLAGTARDPQGCTSGSYRVLRGGGWFYDSVVLRCASRFRRLPEFHNENSGFRCARGLP